VEILAITNRVLKTEPVRWRELTWLQNANLKDMSKPAYEKLRKSIVTNGFIAPFHIWQSKNETYILDGHHRQKVMAEMEKDGFAVPDMLPANFVDCKSMREAKKLVLVYSAIYAQVTDEGLYEYLNIEGLNFDDIKLEVEFPKIDLDKFERGWIKDDFHFRPDKGFAWQGEAETEHKIQLPAEFMEEFQNRHTVICSFSGGKDSSAALLVAKTLLPDKEFIALFVDIGAELPSVMWHVHEFSTWMKIPLEIIRGGKDFFSYVHKVGRWPSLIYRDCISQLIIQPMSRHIKGHFNIDDIIFVRGGQAKQSVRGSVTREAGMGFPGQKKLFYWNPIYWQTDETIIDVLQQTKAPIWEGYQQGFARTACWCCPGMCRKQAQALQKHFPILADQIRNMEKTLGMMAPTNNKSFDDILGSPRIDDVQPVGDE
jgi:3'-phosphoadenosine 5'-phosphosulfate sulfotransferase (PAPS reductase)/FAD synthetase